MQQPEYMPILLMPFLSVSQRGFILAEQSVLKKKRPCGIDCIVHQKEPKLLERNSTGVLQQLMAEQNPHLAQVHPASANPTALHHFTLTKHLAPMCCLVCSLFVFFFPNVSFGLLMFHLQQGGFLDA